MVTTHDKQQYMKWLVKINFTGKHVLWQNKSQYSASLHTSIGIGADFGVARGQYYSVLGLTGIVITLLFIYIALIVFAASMCNTVWGWLEGFCY